MSRQEILEAVNAWLDTAADPTNPDKSLTIEKTSYIRSALTGQLEQAEFTVRIASIVGHVQIPVPRVQPATKEIIQP